mmetsp:Transcript_40303/g.73010  ORF Transcript_40303/g.73010 Transcript_40303/m.73010 type:complete len:88 (+) Transcript_40303:157-420(+)
MSDALGGQLADIVCTALPFCTAVILVARVLFLGLAPDVIRYLSSGFLEDLYTFLAFIVGACLVRFTTIPLDDDDYSQVKVRLPLLAL